MLLIINNLVASYLPHTKLEVSPKPGRFPKHKRISPMQTLSEQPLFTHRHEEFELWGVGSSGGKKKYLKQRRETLCSLDSITLGNSQSRQSGLGTLPGVNCGIRRWRCPRCSQSGVSPPKRLFSSAPRCAISRHSYGLGKSDWKPQE